MFDKHNTYTQKGISFFKKKGPVHSDELYYWSIVKFRK